MKTTLVFRPMTIADYDAVAGLLDGIPGVRLRDADSIEGVARYLDRNPGMSFVAEADAGVAGCLFGGHDGRRGYLNHLAVAPTYRRRGIATRLVSHALRPSAGTASESSTPTFSAITRKALGSGLRSDGRSGATSNGYRSSLEGTRTARSDGTNGIVTLLFSTMPRATCVLSDAGCSSTLEPINFSAHNRFRLGAG
jgi:GNAT superfamily N-acetyltransferase